MKKSTGDLIQSDKFVASIAGVVTAIADKKGIKIPPKELTAVLSPIFAHFVEQRVDENDEEIADSCKDNADNCKEIADNCKETAKN